MSDGNTNVRITFDNTPSGTDFINPTKEEHAAFFKPVKCQIGLGVPLFR